MSTPKTLSRARPPSGKMSRRTSVTWTSESIGKRWRVSGRSVVRGNSSIHSPSDVRPVRAPSPGLFPEEVRGVDLDETQHAFTCELYLHPVVSVVAAPGGLPPVTHRSSASGKQDVLR